MAATPLTPATRTPALLVLLMVLSLAAGIGQRAPAPPDEPRFVLAARAMVDTGQWLLPHRGSELYAEKPPVFMWLQAGAYQLMGDWNIAFLLPSLLAALLTLWLTWDITRRLWNARIARYAVLALFCSLQFGLMAKRAQIDMVLLALTTLSLWALLRYLLGRHSWPLLACAGIAAGVGTVTKGVGFLPLLIMPAGWLWRRCRSVEDSPWPPISQQSMVLLATFISGTGVWLGPLLLALYHTPDPALLAYAHELLFKQTATRYAAAWHHTQPAWYYLPVMLTLWLPGSALLPWLLPAWWHRVRRGDPRVLLPLAWALMVLVFFSASPGKREVYVLPMLPALALASAPLLPALLRKRNVRGVLLAYCVALSVAALVIGAAAWQHSAWISQRLLARHIDTAVLPAIAPWLLGLGGLGAATLWWRRKRNVAVTTAVLTALLWICYGAGLMPALDPYRSSAQLMARAKSYLGPHDALGMIAWREQNLLQTSPQATDFGFKQPVEQQWQAAARWLASAPAQRWLFVLDSALSECVDTPAVIDLGYANGNHWLLLPGTAVDVGCITHRRPADARRPTGT